MIHARQSPHGSSKAARPDMQHAAEAALRAQATRGLALALKNQSGHASIRLDPQHMGTLRVDVTVQNSEVVAVFRPTTLTAQRLLESDRGALEHALQTRGLRVERIEILPAEEGVFDRHAAREMRGEDTPRGSGQQSDGGGQPGTQGGDSGSQRSAGGAATSVQSTQQDATQTSAAEHAESASGGGDHRSIMGFIDTIA